MKDHRSFDLFGEVAIVDKEILKKAADTVKDDKISVMETTPAAPTFQPVIGADDEILTELNQRILDINKKMVEAVDNEVIDYLKKNGYRPKRSAEYCRGLRYRLHKKGLILIVEHCTSYGSYIYPTHKITMEIRVRLIPYDEYLKEGGQAK